MFKFIRFIARLLFSLLMIPCLIVTSPFLLIMVMVSSESWEDFKDEFIGVNKMALEGTIFG